MNQRRKESQMEHGHTAINVKKLWKWIYLQIKMHAFYLQVQEVVPGSYELTARPVKDFCLWRVQDSHITGSAKADLIPSVVHGCTDSFLNFLFGFSLCSTLISEADIKLVVLQGEGVGFCCRDSCWCAGERHLFYCPRWREAINAFLALAPSPSFVMFFSFFFSLLNLLQTLGNFCSSAIQFVLNGNINSVHNWSIWQL